MKLLPFLRSMSVKERNAFAERCGTSAGHLMNIAYGYKPCGVSMAINIERESGRSVVCETLRADVDWAYLRSSPRERSARRSA